MGFKCGIVGLPNVGKSTLFNAITKAGAASENYPFCTIDPNVGIVDVPDGRLKEITQHIKPQKIIPASMEFVDIAGLVKGASKGEGLGNKFLANIRETDAICHVVRCFEDDDITHVDGSVDPIRDIEVINTELVLADLDTVEKAKTRFKKQTKSGMSKELSATLEMLETLDSAMQKMIPARLADIQHLLAGSDEIMDAYKQMHLITSKKVLYVCNVSEDMADGSNLNDHVKAVRAYAENEGSEWVIVSGKIEAELSELEEDEQIEMLSELGLKEPGLDRLIRSGYRLLGLQTYFTAGEKEVRAWTIRKGDLAPAAAGKIHSDFERGFICAEVYTLNDLRECKSKAKLKETGKIRIEGKGYEVKDGDIMEFRFNV